MALFLASTPHRRVVVGASPAARAALTTGNHDLYPGGYGGRKLTAFTVTPRLNTVLGGKITKRTIWWVTYCPGFKFKLRHDFKYMYFIRYRNETFWKKTSFETSRQM